MTNMAPSENPQIEPIVAEHHEQFYRLMAEYGIDAVHGMELMHAVKMCAHAYENIMAERMRAEHISAPRWRILLRLLMAERGGQPTLSPTQLSRSQRLSKNTISAHLRSLEDQELIERRTDPDDLRQFRIRLSAAGRELIRCCTPGHMRFLNELAADLSPAEVEDLRRLLLKLHRSLLRHSDSADRPEADGP